MGTVNVLDAARNTPTVEAVVVITTDKVYLPPHLAAPVEDGSSVVQPDGRPHREGDPLGAEDPYGWSKVAAEHAVAAFRALPEIDGSPAWAIPMATARAGNVLGGGDWSSERLVPDCIRSFMRSEPVELRYPGAVRPWQHVLDPLNGYLLLAEDLLDHGGNMAGSFNFGPRTDDERTVGEVAERLARLWGPGAEARNLSKSAEPHENPMLRLDSTMAANTLGWSPVWNLDETLQRTVEWYRAVLDGADAAEVTDRQITAYEMSGTP
jgi:CDP-glucose 4,6-dehydratase